MAKKYASESATTSVSKSHRYWRRTATPKGWWPWGIAPLVSLGLLLLFGALFMAPRIEAEVRGEVAARISAAGLTATGVASSGQGVNIEAVVPREQEIYVEAIAKATQCDTWAGQLTCPTTVSVDVVEPQAAPALQSVRPHPFTVEKTANAVLLSGEVPNLEEHDRIVHAAGQQFDEITNMLSVSNDAAGPNYSHAADQAIMVASRLDSGTASWSGEVLSVQGVAAAGSIADVQQQFGAINDESLRGDFDVRSLVDRASCNADFGAALTEASVRFRTGSAEIDSGNEQLLARLADLANNCPGNLTIAGHTDSQGDADMNEGLSRARAAAVLDALATLGISAERMQAVGYGAAQPIADNATSVGRAQNRRIAITIDETH